MSRSPAPTGVGKSYLACALAHKACRLGYSARYRRLPRLLGELGIARADGRYGKLLGELAKTDLLVLDDWGLAPLNDEQRRDLLEILDDRFNARAPPSSPANYPWSTGTTTSPTRRSPTPSSTGSCAAPTRLRSTASPCASAAAN